MIISESAQFKERMSRYTSSYSSAGVAVGSYDRPEQSVSTIMNNISKVRHLSTFT